MNKRKRKHLLKLTRQYKSQIIKEIFTLSRKDADDYLNKIKKLRNNDVLFLDSKNRNDPYIDTSSTNDYAILQGYVNTSIFLLTIIEYGRSYHKKEDYLYPALFNFRLYLENVMKIIILRLCPERDVSKFNHDLRNMWNVVLNYIGVDSDTKNIGHLISDFQKHDEKACNLRFVYDLNRSVDTEEKNKSRITMQIDITHIKTMFLHLYRFFDGIYEDLTINNDSDEV